MAEPSRYLRQTVLPEIGEVGQARLGRAAVLIVGCGGLGSALAQLLVRAGVGRVRVVDADAPEGHNLHRQILYDEQDVAAGMAKPLAAAHHLAAINSEVVIEPVVGRFTAANGAALTSGVDLVLDATDNHATRYLLNDVCLEHGLPWIYGGASGTLGMTMNLVCGDGPCLRCIFAEPPAPAVSAEAPSPGIIGPLPVLIASMQATEALKILVGARGVSRDLVIIDPWQNRCERFPVERAPDCPACGHGRRDYLRQHEELAGVGRNCR